ncbi:hypothetical protein MRQ36_01815 [Micromonospora sp. R77]|nr:hypothetical protein [Micromonospora sp. R77]MCI4061377.1 hypothetical protein [Micromonospora sp. R77]
MVVSPYLEDYSVLSTGGRLTVSKQAEGSRDAVLGSEEFETRCRRRYAT